MLTKKEIQFIQSLKLKKYRHKTATFIAEGEKWLNEIIAAKTTVKQIYTCSETIYNAIKKVMPYANKVTLINEKTLNKISQQKTPNKVLCLLPFLNNEINNKTLQQNYTLVCDDIRDPGNLGTIIRTACWFGVKQIILSKSCVDIYNAKVIQSTMGALLHSKIIYKNLEELFNNNKNIPIYATSLKGELLNKTKTYATGFILIGNEANGISKPLLKLSKHHIKIKGGGKAESLNAAVAAGIVLNYLMN